MTELIGYVAAFLFAIVAVPLAFDAWKEGRSDENLIFLCLWFAGEVLMTIYVYLKHGWDLPLMINYLGNIFFLLVVFKYRLFPKEKT